MRIRKRNLTRQTTHRRSAVVVLELILGLPILVIFFFAIVEFGLILALSKQVSYASKYGAKLASEELRSNALGIGDMNLPAGGSRLRIAIDRYLETAGMIPGACEVTLEHNVVGIASPVQVDPPGGCPNCDPPITPLPTPQPACDAEGRPAPETVRVTVCVSIADHIPDLLCGFGFSIEDCVISETTTYRYEDCPGGVGGGGGGGGAGGGGGGGGGGDDDDDDNKGKGKGKGKGKQ